MYPTSLQAAPPTAQAGALAAAKPPETPAEESDKSFWKGVLNFWKGAEAEPATQPAAQYVTQPAGQFAAQTGMPVQPRMQASPYPAASGVQSAHSGVQQGVQHTGFVPSPQGGSHLSGQPGFFLRWH